MRIVVLSGGAAGMSAAAKAKRLSPDAEVVVYEQGGFVSYGACGLPYYVSGLNPDYTKMLIRSPEEFQRQGVQVHLYHQALRVSPADKTVLIRNLTDGGMLVEHYDKLMLATGARAIVPRLPGVELPGVHTLKTLDDGLTLQKNLEGKRQIVVVGGGYIGVEVAESLRGSGREVRLIEAAPDILAPFDPPIREILRRQMEEAGIAVHTGEALRAILPNADGFAVGGVETAAGTYLADLVVLALGVRPCTAFLEGTGIRRMKNGAIEVDREMRTSIPDIYATGDCACVYNRIEERKVYSALGTVANKCGRIAGENMLGAHVRFDGCLGSSAISVCGMEAARTGMGEATARELFGEDVSVVDVQTHDRAPYYPDPTPLLIRLICQKRSRRILGGQAVGRKGAVLRVGSLAMAITGGLTAPELGMSDLCYAPPFAEVWDALNVAGNAVK